MLEPAARIPRYGYRGRALTLVGLVWILVGLTVLREPERVPLVSEWLPLWLRVALWTGAGLVALLTSWWPPGRDRWGFMALVVPAAIRALAYAWSWTLGLVSDGELGDSADWIGATGWVAIVGFVLLLAAWPEPVTITREETL